MNKDYKLQEKNIITAGSNYLDIDAYACMVAMAELLRLKGKNAIAHSTAPCNYSVCQSLITEGQIIKSIPQDIQQENANYIIVDVSDPNFLKDSVPLDCVTAVYDHHTGFEAYWNERIGENAYIEFIGAAATLVYREWKKAGLQDRMSRSTVLLLIAAILDNTLNLTSSNTTAEDIETFEELCKKENIGAERCASYFAEVQKNIEADLENALQNDRKYVGQNRVLPAYMMQLCIWDADGMLERISDIRKWCGALEGGWMLNLIDIRHQCSYFVCDDINRQKEIERIFDVRFESGIARSAKPYLRKQIIKCALNSK